MQERKGYTNTGELQADDEMSPRPSFEDRDSGAAPRRKADDGQVDDQRAPGLRHPNRRKTMSKITDGLNDRPRDVTIGQSGPGLPDDSSQPIEVTEEEAERIRAKFEDDARAKVKKEIEEQIEKPEHGSA